MSETCEHPFCTRSILQKCSNHCQLDLCEEHIIEHKNLFLAQYEKSFINLTKLLNESLHSIEEQKSNVNFDYQKGFSSIHEKYQMKLNEINEKSRLIMSTQKLIEKKVQLLTDIKHDKAVLNQYDIEQMKLYLNKLQEYPQEEVTIKNDETVPVNSSVDEEDGEEEKEEDEGDNDNDDDDDDDDFNYSRTNSNRESTRTIIYRAACPLTCYGAFGLEKRHNIRLCSEDKNRDDRQLFSHLHHYHHLTSSIAYRITKAIRYGWNPLTTCIFSSERKVIDKRYDTIECPLKKIKLADCKSKFFRCSLKLHLLNVHQLTLKTSNRIVDAVRTYGDISNLDLDEEEFQ
ncbi:hypothetical protein I4U23_007045 [Adineta vaga]|nr:hypothetical protein I4U23_007045 [Adineta vaga]